MKQLQEQLQDLNIPQYNSMHKKSLYDDESIPVVKYVVIAKTYEREKTLSFFRTHRQARYYGIGILTERNQYYYNEFQTNKVRILRSHIDIFSKLFLKKFRFTHNTKILFVGKIKDTEPIYIFTDILMACFDIRSRSASKVQMLRAVNRYYHIVKVKGNKSANKNHFCAIIDGLIRKNAFEFITDQEWSNKIQLMTTVKRKGEIDCALGILFLHVTSMYTRNTYKYRENKKSKENSQEKNV